MKIPTLEKAAVQAQKPHIQHDAMGIKSTLSLKTISTDGKDQKQKKDSDKDALKNTVQNQTKAAVHIQINKPTEDKDDKEEEKVSKDTAKFKDKFENKVGLVLPPKKVEQQSLKTPLIVEHRDEKHDLKTYYNPNIKPNPHEYVTEAKKVQNTGSQLQQQNKTQQATINPHN